MHIALNLRACPFPPSMHTLLAFVKRKHEHPEAPLPADDERRRRAAPGCWSGGRGERPNASSSTLPSNLPIDEARECRGPARGAENIGVGLALPWRIQTRT